jgi:hypothetical protein
MQGSVKGVDAERSWAINRPLLTQRMTGVQRYVYEIVAELDGIFSQKGDLARRLPMRRILPPGAEAMLALSTIGKASGQVMPGISSSCPSMREAGY